MRNYQAMFGNEPTIIWRNGISKIGESNNGPRQKSFWNMSIRGKIRNLVLTLSLFSTLIYAPLFTLNYGSIV